MLHPVRLRSLLAFAFILLITAEPGCAASATAASAGDSKEGGSAVIAGSSNPMRFHPKEAAASAIDVDSLNLRYVFEAIGEDATLWYQHVQTLANPYFEGRADGSAGIERARDYIEFHFKRCGLEPAFPAGDASSKPWVSYRQPFEFHGGRRVEVTVEHEHAAINDQRLVEHEDFVVLGNSATGEAAGPVTFVGYGINRGRGGYSSFDEDCDLAGRIALLLRYEPLDDEGNSRWTDTGFSPQAGLARKMNAVTERGAAGIILVNPPGCREGKTGLESLEGSRGFGRSAGVPTIQITPDVADRLLRTADPKGRDLLTFRQLADLGEVKTVELDDSYQVRFGAVVERKRSSEMIPAANVGAVLRGQGALADEWLVIGAHFDHNGYGWFGTTPEAGPLMPGADDNASGTAGLLVLARMLSETYADADEAEDLRSILFLAFDAEERGLHGSRFYCEHPTIPPQRMTALLNMDMIGRLRSDQLSIFGAGTGEGMPEIIEPHIENSGLRVSVSLAGSGQADDANFRSIGVPAMHFFTGVHPEYTSPADQAWTVNPIGAAKVLDLIYDISMDLVSRRELIAYVEPEPTRGHDRGYARVRLGIRPGMADDLETGILVEGVSLDTSAHAAGIKAGDILLAWDGDPLESMRDLFNHLQEHEPGDVVILTIQRGEEELELTVTLKASEGGDRGRGAGGG
jgi:aminopeptidase YwaD